VTIAPDAAVNGFLGARHCCSTRRISELHTNAPCLPDYVSGPGTTLCRTEKKDRADSSRQQHNSGASVGNGVRLVIFIVAVSAVIIIVAAVIVAVSIRQDGENQSGGC